MPYAAFRSIGAYVPAKILTNADLAQMVDTSDEWITKRTGIEERHIAAKDETTSDMGYNAAKLAIEKRSCTSRYRYAYLCNYISRLLLYALNSYYHSQ